jgi:hypothetical protein
MTNLQGFHLPFSNTSTEDPRTAFRPSFRKVAARRIFYDTTTANPWPALGHACAKLTALFDQVCEYRTNQTEGPGSPKVFSKQGFGGFEVRHKKRDTFTVFFCDPFKDPAPPS